MYEGRMPWLVWLLRGAPVYTRMFCLCLCTQARRSRAWMETCATKGFCWSTISLGYLWPIAKSTYILIHMHRYYSSAAINNKDNGRKSKPNFIIIWQMKKIKLNLLFLENNSRLCPGSHQGTTQPWNKTKKLYQVSATLCFIKQFQFGDCAWKELYKVLLVCPFFLSAMPLSFILKAEYICLHSEDTWSSFRVLVQLLCWYEKMSKSTR